MDGGDQASEPASCTSEHQCTVPRTPGLQTGQSLHKGRSDRQKGLGDRTSGLALSDSKPWGKACLSHWAQPTSLATRFPLLVIPASVQQLVWPSIQQILGYITLVPQGTAYWF